MSDVYIAFGLTVLAGMATGIGSIIAFLASRTNYRFLSVATGFSAGVILYVSFDGSEPLVDEVGGPSRAPCRAVGQRVVYRKRRIG